MIVIPAIDIKGGRCVRLQQGQMSKETIYSEFPEQMAARWISQGAERLHLVDLDGAIKGKPVNRETIVKIVKTAKVPIELGGGIRDMETIEVYLALGIQQVILGTIAIKNPEFVTLACKEFPDRIIVGIDAKNNRVAVEGWTEETDMVPVEMAMRYETIGVSAIIYTDIQRDGMSTGPNIDATRALAQAIQIPVIVSGGISGIEDVTNILPLAEYGVIGMITGRAIYKETLNLAEAIKLTKNVGGII